MKKKPFAAMIATVAVVSSTCVSAHEVTLQISPKEKVTLQYEAEVTFNGNFCYDFGDNFYQVERFQWVRLHHSLAEDTYTKLDSSDGNEVYLNRDFEIAVTYDYFQQTLTIEGSNKIISLNGFEVKSIELK